MLVFVVGAASFALLALRLSVRRAATTVWVHTLTLFVFGTCACLAYAFTADALFITCEYVLFALCSSFLLHVNV